MRASVCACMCVRVCVCVSVGACVTEERRVSVDGTALVAGEVCSMKNRFETLTPPRHPC